jgi:hypothetical protein
MDGWPSVGAVPSCLATPVVFAGPFLSSAEKAVEMEGSPVRESSCPSFASCLLSKGRTNRMYTDRTSKKHNKRSSAGSYLLPPPSCFCRRARAHVAVCSEWCDPTELWKWTPYVASPRPPRGGICCCAGLLGIFCAGHQRTTPTAYRPTTASNCYPVRKYGRPGPPRPPCRSSSRRLRGPPRGASGCSTPTYSNDGTYRNASSPISDGLLLRCTRTTNRRHGLRRGGASGKRALEEATRRCRSHAIPTHGAAPLGVAERERERKRPSVTRVAIILHPMDPHFPDDGDTLIAVAEVDWSQRAGIVPVW